MSMPKQVCRLVEQALKDEQEAVRFYKNASTKLRFSEYPSLSVQFWKIAQDEEQHKKALEKIHRTLCKP